MCSWRVSPWPARKLVSDSGISEGNATIGSPQSSGPPYGLREAGANWVNEPIPKHVPCRRWDVGKPWQQRVPANGLSWRGDRRRWCRSRRLSRLGEVVGFMVTARTSPGKNPKYDGSRIS